MARKTGERREITLELSSALTNVPCLRSQSAPHNSNLRHTHASKGAWEAPTALSSYAQVVIALADLSPAWHTRVLCSFVVFPPWNAFPPTCAAVSRPAVNDDCWRRLLANETTECAGRIAGPSSTVYCRAKWTSWKIALIPTASGCATLAYLRTYDECGQAEKWMLLPSHRNVFSLRFNVLCMKDKRV